MKNIALKQIHYAGITMQVPEIWDVETEEFNEEDGTKSYSLSINAKGRDIRSIDISCGTIPEGSDAYLEACRTYEEVVIGDDLSADEEPIITAICEKPIEIEIHYGEKTKIIRAAVKK